MKWLVYVWFELLLKGISGEISGFNEKMLIYLLESYVFFIIFKLVFFFFSLLYLELGYFSSVAYLTVGNLAQPGISVSVRSQYLVRLLSLYWITVGHTIHSPIEGLLPPTGIEPTPFRNPASKVAGLQVHATIPRHYTQFKTTITFLWLLSLDQKFYILYLYVPENNASRTLA